MTIKQLEKRLKDILTDDCCGIALGRHNKSKKFIIYHPTFLSSEVLGYGDTLEETIASYDKWCDKNLGLRDEKYKKWSHPPIS